MTVPPAPSGDVAEGEHTSLTGILQDIIFVHFPASAVTVGMTGGRYLFVDILSMNLCNLFCKPTDIVYRQQPYGAARYKSSRTVELYE